MTIFSRTEQMYCRGGNLPPATYRIQPVRVNGTTSYTEQCSGDDSSPLQPRRGAGPVSNITRLVERYHPIQRQTFLRWTIQIQMYHGSGPAGRVVVLRAANQKSLIAGGNHTIISSVDCRRYSGCTMYRVIPFTPTGCTSNVAGGRLPPLQARPRGYRLLIRLGY